MQNRVSEKNGIRYGYMRLLTKNQFKSDNQLNQLDELKVQGINEENIFFDNLSGSKVDNRVELQKLLSTVESGDEIVVTKLDRLARNTQDALQLAEELTSKGVTLNILNMGKFDNSPLGKVMFTMFSAFAEYELAMITERLQGGREWKRQNDPTYLDGRKRKLTPNQMNLMYEHYKSGQETIQEIADSFGIKSRKTVYNYIKRYEKNKLK